MNINSKTGGIMDIACPRCGEPWDLDCLHEQAAEAYGVPYYLDDDTHPSWERPRGRARNPAYSSEEYERVFAHVSAAFRTSGCSALTVYGATCSKEPVSERGVLLANVAYELCGDDLDGAAAVIDDLGGSL
jgi:hypothetical protein